MPLASKKRNSGKMKKKETPMINLGYTGKPNLTKPSQKKEGHQRRNCDHNKI